MPPDVPPLDAAPPDAARRSTPSPEFAFVCACAGSRAPPRPGGDLGGDLSGDLDGALLAAIAHRHQVVPLVVEGLKRHRLPIPSALAARHDPLAPLRAAREAIRLRTLLMAEGIEPIFLKGSALAVLAYGAIGRRQFGDIDLLVRPVDARRAAARLENAGYRARSDAGGNPADAMLANATLADRVARLSPLAKDMEVRHAGNGQIVELHWRMTDALRERPVWDREAVQWVELAPGAAVPTLATDALFAYVCNLSLIHI